MERTETPEFFDDLISGWSEVIAALGEVAPLPVSLGPVIVFTHDTCPSSPGEAADCAAAAHVACGREGFGSGSNLDVVTGRVCRAGFLAAHDGLHDDTCKPKTWITRAVCW